MMRKVGEITVFWGGMFSGKTTALIRRLAEYGEGAFCCKPKTDTRATEEEVISHDGLEFPATAIDRASSVFLLLNGDIKVVGIDEASLFGDDLTLVPTVLCLRDMGFDVVISGLDMTSEERPFGQMPLLAAIADNCFKLRAKCASCGKDASLSHYSGKEKKIGDIKVGGGSTYTPLCRNCAVIENVK